MKRDILVKIVLIFFTIFNLSKSENKEESGSPYFLVQGESDVESFPLLETKVKANIAGITSEVELTQVYKNDGKKTIEAVYIFPLGTKSAIHSMRMIIGDRIIDAEIKKKEEARKDYEDAKKEGKVASLLEQMRPNVFQMNVANIMPGDEVRVIVRYTEILIPEKGVYEFVFPTVVGPRFTGESKTKEKWTATPYLHEKEKPTYKFDIEVNLKTGIPISKIEVSTHKVDIVKEEDKAKVTLSKNEKYGGNRDFILRYSLKGNKIQSGLLLYPDKDENFFLLLVEPPERVSIDSIPARDYIFVVDVSGSMNGFPLEISKKVVKQIINGLRNKDYFNILFFAGGSEVLSPVSLEATESNKKRAIEMLESQRGGGGTEILSAFEKVVKLPKKEGISRIIVTLTDGYVDVEKGVFDIIRGKLGEMNFFTFGIGTSVNRYLIEGMSRVGRGESFVVESEGKAEEAASRFMNYIKYPLLTDIRLLFKGFESYEVEPPSVPDLFAERPIVVMGKYKRADGVIRLEGKKVGEKYVKEIVVKSVDEDKNNSAIKYLWAREVIARLDDYGKVGVDVKEEVTKLGLKYSLMTQYTSFVAVDKIKRNTGEIVTVKQPLPLPEGVSDLAVGEDKKKVRPLKSKKEFAFMLAPMQEKKFELSKKKEEKKEREIDTEESTKKEIVFKIINNENKEEISGELREIFINELTQPMNVIFKNWNLTSLTLIIDIEQGKIKEIKISNYKVSKGEGCKECIERSLIREVGNLNLPKEIKVSLEVTIEYN